MSKTKIKLFLYPEDPKVKNCLQKNMSLAKVKINQREIIYLHLALIQLSLIRPRNQNKILKKRILSILITKIKVILLAIVLNH